MTAAAQTADLTASLARRTYLITGGTSGIGKATALALAKAGANVVITGRRQAEGDAVAGALRDVGVKAAFERGDVTDERHVERAVARAAELGGGTLDGALNNAGLELMGVELKDSTIEQYKQVFDVNVLGVLLALKHELRVMGKGGSIVSTASIAGRIGMPGAGIYIATKHAVLGLTRAAAMEAAPRGIRVNSVSPAAIETDMFDRFTGNRNADMIKYMTALHPIGRLGQSEEIAGPVLFLLSDAASFITGHDLLVDGGFTVP